MSDVFALRSQSMMLVARSPRNNRVRGVLILVAQLVLVTLLDRTSERWHPLPGAPRRNRAKCSSKESHVNSRRGSGLSSRALFDLVVVSLIVEGKHVVRGEFATEILMAVSGQHPCQIDGFVRNLDLLQHRSIALDQSGSV